MWDFARDAAARSHLLAVHVCREEMASSFLPLLSWDLELDRLQGLLKELLLWLSECHGNLPKRGGEYLQGLEVVCGELVERWDCWC